MEKSSFFEILETLFPGFKRICIVTNCFPPYPKEAYSLSIGGIPKKYEQIAKELRHFRKEFSVISLYYGKVTDHQDSPNVRRIGVYHPYTHSKWRRILFLLELFNPLVFPGCVTVLSKDRPDAVVIGETRGISLAPIIAAKLLGFPVVVQHDWLCPLSPKKEACSPALRVRNCGECLEEELMSRQNSVVKLVFGVFSAFMLMIKKHLWNKCLVLAEGDYFRNLYVASGIAPEKIRIAPPSPTVFDSTKCDDQFMNRLRTTVGDAKVIAYVGRLSAEKGIKLLLESFRSLKRRTNNAIKLVIAGDGALHDLVAKEAENDLEIVFLGWLDENELSCVYSVADIVAIPTLRPDVYPHVALEALSFGKEVIGFKMGGLVEIAKKNELVKLVEKVDAMSLADMIVNRIHAAIRS